MVVAVGTNGKGNYSSCWCLITAARPLWSILGCYSTARFVVYIHCSVRSASSTDFPWSMEFQLALLLRIQGME